MLTTSAHVAAEVVALRAEVRRLQALLASTDTQPSVPIPIIDNEPLEYYRHMIETNGNGRIGRTHRADVDQLLDSAKKELDCYLRRTIKNIIPVNAKYAEVNPDQVFATLSAFGLRLEDRGLLADVALFEDKIHQGRPTVRRLENFAAYYYTPGSGFERYWRASAIETVLGLARYRGLFNPEGFLKEGNQGSHVG